MPPVKVKIKRKAEENENSKENDWDAKRMRLAEALEKVNKQGWGYRKAAKFFKISRCVIRRHARGEAKFYSNGPKPLLTQEEEVSLLNYIKYVTRRGFCLTIDILQSEVHTKC